MKILIIMGGFFPGKKYGGPPVSVDNFCSLIKEDADCYIVTHNHDMGEEEPYQDIKESCSELRPLKLHECKIYTDVKVLVVFADLQRIHKRFFKDPVAQ